MFDRDQMLRGVAERSVTYVMQERAKPSRGTISIAWLWQCSVRRA
ncbi:MAG: hypothetical protein WDO74_35735 [Pseudomonadota bacterium]